MLPEEIEPDKKEDLDKADTPMSIDSPGRLSCSGMHGSLLGSMGKGSLKK